MKLASLFRDSLKFPLHGPRETCQINSRCRDYQLQLHALQNQILGQGFPTGSLIIRKKQRSPSHKPEIHPETVFFISFECTFANFYQENLVKMGGNMSLREGSQFVSETTSFIALLSSLVEL